MQNDFAFAGSSEGGSRRGTAQFVHILSNNGGHIALDFHAEYTALYRSRRGAFFVADRGGALRPLEAFSE